MSAPGPAAGARSAAAEEAVPSGPDGTDRRVRVAQVALLKANLPTILGGTFLGGCLITGFLLWLTPHDAAALGWLAALGAITLGRAAHGLYLHRRPTTLENVDGRVAALTASIVPNALAWGTLGWYAAGSDDPMVIVVVVMVLTGLTASGVGFIAHFRAMFLLYVSIMIVPVAVRLALFESVGLRWLGALLAAYLATSILASRSTARAVVDALRLQFENTDLVARLGAEIRRADEARAEAERASRAKSVFLGAASHDLRQPLHSLRLLSTTLDARVRRPRAPGDDGGTERALVRKMDESVRALEELFDSILDVSRLDAGTLAAEVRDVPLAPVLERVRRHFAPLAHLRGLAFGVGPTRAHVRTDPLLLERLLGNLVANALRYTPRGSVRLTVGVDAEPGGRVRIAVVDTGIGIPAAERERVFEEFVQLGNPERDRSRGIGLGLSIVRRLAALLDVEVELDSREGRGTRFVIGLEAGVARVPSTPPVPADVPVRAPARTGLAGAFVLVIDDEREVREATRALLESWSCRVLGASSAPEAIASLEGEGRMPDVIVSDYRLHGERTGIDAIRAVRERAGSAVPALLVTGDVAPEQLVRMRDSGLPVLHKPCSPDALAALLAGLVVADGAQPSGGEGGGAAAAVGGAA